MSSLNNKTYMSLEEAAEFLSISKSELYKKTASQSIPHYKLSRRLIRFEINELKNYMNSFKVEPINQ
ncbi:MAG: helix-turn-helix domain-containing protein [Saprospiraceae bacterium]